MYEDLSYHPVVDWLIGEKTGYMNPGCNSRVGPKSAQTYRDNIVFTWKGAQRAVRGNQPGSRHGTAPKLIQKLGIENPHRHEYSKDNNMDEKWGR